MSGRAVPDVSAALGRRFHTDGMDHAEKSDRFPNKGQWAEGLFQACARTEDEERIRTDGTGRLFSLSVNLPSSAGHIQMVPGNRRCPLAFQKKLRTGLLHEEPVGAYCAV